MTILLLVAMNLQYIAYLFVNNNNNRQCAVQQFLRGSLLSLRNFHYFFSHLNSMQSKSTTENYI